MRFLCQVSMIRQAWLSCPSSQPSPAPQKLENAKKELKLGLLGGLCRLGWLGLTYLTSTQPHEAQGQVVQPQPQQEGVQLRPSNALKLLKKSRLSLLLALLLWLLQGETLKKNSESRYLKMIHKSFLRLNSSRHRSASNSAGAS